MLIPGGGLTVVWNHPLWTPDEHPWLPEFHALCRRSGRRRSAAEYVHTIDGDDFVALVRSWSWVANLPDDERARVLARVRAMVGEAPELHLRYRTDVRWTRLA